MSNSIKKAQYGHWPSPITAERLSKSSISIHEVAVSTATSQIFWLESRPQENGRFTIVERAADGVREVLPKRFSARAGVHDLGGGSFAVDRAGKIIFVDESTQKLYELDPVTEKASLLLEAEQDTRRASFAPHPHDHQWLVAIKEDHRNATPETQAHAVRNSLVAIDRSSGHDQEIAKGDDFYAYPTFSEDGRNICWVQWSHPDMPWTGSSLYVADWVDGSVANVRKVAGQHQTQSVSQPRWTPDNRMLFADDQSGYWQLYIYSSGADSPKPLVFKGLEHSEFAIADWKLGSSSFVALDKDTVVASVVQSGGSKIVLLDLETETWRDLELRFVNLALPGTGLFKTSADSFAVLGSTIATSKQLAHITGVRSENLRIDVLQKTTDFLLDDTMVSKARPLTIARTSRKGYTHAFFFGPQNADYEGQPGTLPPCLVHLHGGPNGCTTPALDLAIQFWTTRGYTVCAVNYSGSTGYGRRYREELTGHWGLYDIQDVYDVATYLVAEGLADGSRLGVYGGSAGGYATLAAIHMYPSTFAAAISSYGISDVRALQSNSYKFESQDVERLILSSFEPNDEVGRDNLLRERSPLFHVQNVKAPLLILQGLDDVVVLPEQSRMIAEEMNRRGSTVKLVEFPGEGHGWLRAETILQAYTEQEAWWKRHLCFT